MSINLSGIKQQHYQGVPAGLALQIAGARAFAVPLMFNWANYGAGVANPAVAVGVNFTSGSGSSPRPPLDAIRSVYIDNTNSAVPVYVQFSDTLFTIAAQPYSTGWYPVFTNSFIFTVAAIGFTATNVSATNVFITNVFAPPFTDVALPQAQNLNLASPVIGGGASLANIFININGQDYNNGDLSIVGGGGSGAAAHGLLDNFGRFTDIILDDAGEGFTGTPIITATGGQTIPPNFSLSPLNTGQHVVYQNIEYIWNGQNGTNFGAAAWVRQDYNTGSQVSYQGNIYFADQPITIHTAPPGSAVAWTLLGTQFPSTQAPWTSSGTPPGTIAQFGSALSAVSSSITTAGFGVEALGDQAASFVDIIGGVGVFRQNLFGSPYSSGFIYLTHIFAANLAAGISSVVWELVNEIGYAPFSFECGDSVQTILELQKMNMKLDATQNWQLNATSVPAGGQTVIHGFTWTYSQQ